jgi:hypothetical protein
MAKNGQAETVRILREWMAREKQIPLHQGSGEEVGDQMPDGTIYSGISPDTNKPIYTTLKDAPLTVKWKQAMEYAAQLEAHGHRDWRLPTKGELNVLFQNRAAIGHFNQSGSDHAGCHWSSRTYYHYSSFGWAQRFSDGNQHCRFMDFDSSLRCVRG